MTESASAASGRIFMSYRREETAYAAGWLYDRLIERFGDGQVFKDVDSIEVGDDFVEAIATAVGSCDVLLALIGDRWLTITGVNGRRRLDDPEDFVRLEIETALGRDVRVVPILVSGARMPEADKLPVGLARLVRRQALELSPSRFDADLSRLLRVLDASLAEARRQAGGWIRREAGSPRSQGRPETPERHGNTTDALPAARRDTTGHHTYLAPAPAAPSPGPWWAGPHGTAGGTGSARAASSPAWYRRLIGYGRFWSGLLLLLAGWIPFLANLPHYYGYEKYPNVAHLHVYIELGLAVPLLLGTLLLVSALISAGRGAP